MIRLTALNLLPYREMERERKQKEFNRLMILFVALGFVFFAAAYLLLGQMIGNQQNRNEFLKQNISQLDVEIAEVKDLQQKKKAFLIRKQKIEELQNERFKAAMVLNDLNALMPEGVYLLRIESSDGKTYTLTGRALSDNKVAMLMRSLPSTGLLSSPVLVGIKTNGGAQEFVLRTTLLSANLETEN